MPEYVFSSSMPYTRFLEAHSNEQALLYNIDQRMRAAIGNQQELQRIGVEIRDQIASGTERITLSNETVRDAVHESTQAAYANAEALSRLREANIEGFRELRGVLEEGFGEVTGELREIGYLMRELITVVESPTQTWAGEQYRIALTAFRKGFHRETLDYVGRAIDGHGPHAGFPLDYRFFLLRGEILLGNTRNSDPKLVDPVKACAAFEEATRLAKPDSRPVAARAAQRAGWAAYVAGDVPKALQLTRQVVELDPTLASGIFQLARLEVEQGDVEGGFRRLQELLKNKATLVLAAATDAVFKRFPQQLESTLQAVRISLERKLENALREAMPQFEYLQQLIDSSRFLPEAAKVCERAETFIKPFRELRSQTLLGLVNMNIGSEFITGELGKLIQEIEYAKTIARHRAEEEAAKAREQAESEGLEAYTRAREKEKKQQAIQHRRKVFLFALFLVVLSLYMTS
jgi:tetratricopeptide (TPR) repeat protein